MSESAIESATCRAAKKLGYLSPKQRGEIGIPDRLFIGPGGHMFFVEFKFGSNDRSPHQIKYAQMLAKRGVVCFVARTVAEVTDYIKSWQFGK